MTQMDLFQTATSSQQDTRANHLVSPGSKEAKKMTATSGLKYSALLKQNDQIGLFAKMFMDTLAWGSTQCFLTWKPKATPANRLLFQLAPSMPHTEETGSGLWATPRTTDGTGGPRQLDERGRRISKSSNLVFGANLADQVKMWPTPTVQDSNKATKKWRENHQNNLTAAVFNPEKMWPTPAATNYKGSVKDRYMGSETYRANLDEAVRTHREDGQLNPDWVEWLMGYPPGWTNLQTPQEQSKASGEEQTDLKD